MDAESFASSAATQTVETLHVDDTFGRVVHEVTQDVTDIVELNKSQMASVDERAPFGNGMTMVASIPMSIYHDLVQKGITSDPVRMKAWLNNPDNRVFRTRPGRL